MKIRKTKINNAELSGPERRNYLVLEEAMLQLSHQPKFKNSIGAIIHSKPSGSHLIISAFNNDLLYSFINELMVISSKEELTISFSAKNEMNLWAPVWSNTIKLNNGN